MVFGECTSHLLRLVKLREQGWRPLLVAGQWGIYSTTLSVGGGAFIVVEWSAQKVRRYGQTTTTTTYKRAPSCSVECGLQKKKEKWMMCAWNVCCGWIVGGKGKQIDCVLNRYSLRRTHERFISRYNEMAFIMPFDSMETSLICETHVRLRIISLQCCCLDALYIVSDGYLPDTDAVLAIVGRCVVWSWWS